MGIAQITMNSRPFNLIASVVLFLVLVIMAVAFTHRSLKCKV